MTSTTSHCSSRLSITSLFLLKMLLLFVPLVNGLAPAALFSSTSTRGLTAPLLLRPPSWITQPKRQQLKQKILQLSQITQRGLIATPEQQDLLLEWFEQLEQLNPTPQPLLQPEIINGEWTLKYTTSASILGKNDGNPRVGPILQTLNVSDLTACNAETVQYPLVGKVPRQVTATLEPVNEQLTNVQFQKFTVGPASFPAPKSFRGSLNVTYLEDGFRLSRGDKGNIFVLTKK